jgi:hypothetical protein
MEYKSAASSMVRDIFSTVENRPKSYTLQELKNNDLVIVNAWFFNHTTHQLWKIPYHAFGPGCFHVELYENGVKVGGTNVYDNDIPNMRDHFSIIQLGLEDDEVHHSMR